jgi:bla regulator protein BlaR1
MELYILKSAACLAIFFVFYKAFLENASFHKFKRGYLLGGLIASFAIPFITFTRYVESTKTNFTPIFTSTIENVPVETVVETSFNYTILIWFIYGAGVLFFTVRFIRNLLNITSNIRNNSKEKHGKFIHILLKEFVAPHTFFNNIFFYKIAYNSGNIPQEVIWHEETHAAQKHSLDILLIEILQVVFWFNPFLYVFKNSIKLNHEFLADSAVIKRQQDATSYQKILLDYTSIATSPSMANAINYSSIKKRFTVMKTHTSRKASLFKVVLILPLLCAIIFGFSTTQTIEKTSPLEEVISENSFVAMQLREDIQIDSTTLTAKKESNKTNPKTPSVFEETTFKFNTPQNVNGAATSLKNSYPINTSNSKVFYKRSYSTNPSGMNNDRDKKYNQSLSFYFENDAIFMDGELVAINSFVAVLDKKTSTWKKKDFKLYGLSVQLKNVSEEFITKLNKVYLKSELAKKSSSENPKLIGVTYAPSGPSDTNSLGRFSDNLYPTQLPSLLNRTKNGAIEVKDLRHTINAQNAMNRAHSPPTSTMNQEAYAKEYMEGAKRNNKKAFVLQIEHSEIKFNGIPVSLDRFAEAVDIYTRDWEETDYTAAHPSVLIASTPATYLDKVDTEFRKTLLSKENGGMSIVPPPPPPIVKKGEKSNIPPPPPSKSLFKGRVLKELPPFEKNMGFYYKNKLIPREDAMKLIQNNENIRFGISDSNTNRTIITLLDKNESPPPPPRPIVKKGEKSNIPPPPPKNPLDHIIGMAKKGATFYYEDSEVTSNRAIDLVKNNKNLHINTRKNNGVTTVHLSKK